MKTKRSKRLELRRDRFLLLAPAALAQVAAGLPSIGHCDTADSLVVASCLWNPP